MQSYLVPDELVVLKERELVGRQDSKLFSFHLKQVVNDVLEHIQVHLLCLSQWKSIPLKLSSELGACELYWWLLGSL